MDTIVFALGIFVGGMVSCLVVMNFGIATTLQGFAFLGAGVAIVLASKFAHAWSRDRLSDRRLQKLAENA